MIDHRLDFGVVKHPVFPPPLKIGNGYRRGDLMTENPVKIEHTCPRKRLVSQVCGKNLFSCGLTHDDSLKKRCKEKVIRAS